MALLSRCRSSKGRLTSRRGERSDIRLALRMSSYKGVWNWASGRKSDTRLDSRPMPCRLAKLPNGLRSDTKLPAKSNPCKLVSLDSGDRSEMELSSRKSVCRFVNADRGERSEIELPYRWRVCNPVRLERVEMLVSGLVPRDSDFRLGSSFRTEMSEMAL